MNLDALPWLILFLPLLAAGLITLFTLRNQRLSATLSIGAVVIGFFSTLALIKFGGWEGRELSVNWLSIHDSMGHTILDIDFGLKLDSLSLMMMLVVTGVGGLIHIYSAGYMKEDPGYSRFFACLSLFTFSMLGIVLSTNFVQMFIFWELVGVSSYLLIGFWFEKPSAADAAKKAFITNRLGDFGFMLGILMVWAALHSLNFGNLEDILKADPTALGTGATIVMLLVFCGAVGKSAQFPLHVWLPDAMEGPTPVSALIHAATMVAAGVYMLCRVFFMLHLAPDAMSVIAGIGGFTALLAALIAVQQNDIKRILAYSTLSQLGYMVMAVGLSGPTAAMFHLTTHAFFKALLFLGAGSVIHAMHHEQDIWKMGALRKKLPVTFWTFLVGTIALAGVWPLSGFYSKDAILAQAFNQHTPLGYALFGVGWFVAILTSFYMFRLVFVVFFGDKKSHEADHAHESSSVMLWPLRILGTFSVIGGWIGIEAIFNRFFATESDEPVSFAAGLIAPFIHAPVVACLGLLAAAIGIVSAYLIYGKANRDPIPDKLPGLSRAMQNRFYFDEIYEVLFIRPHDFIAAVANVIDRFVVEGLCLGLVRNGTEFTGRGLRRLQTGNIQTYAFLFVAGVAVILWIVLGR